jgi:Ca2+-binding RTX toxin-like protein
LYGVLGNNTLNGGMGNDRLICGKGHNQLSGGNGWDSFRFLSPSHSTITDFDVTYDHIQLEQAHFSQLNKGWLPADEFVISTKAQDSNDYLIYNKMTGVLRYDDDGNGADAAVQIATLGVKLALTADDFLGI